MSGPAVRWPPHPPDALVGCEVPWVSGGRLTAERLLDQVAGVQAAMPPSDGSPRPVACEGRLATLVALLACWDRGERAWLPANHAPDTLAALGPTALHDGLLADGLDVTRASPAPGRPLRRPPADAVLVVLSTSGSTGTATTHTKTAGQLLGEVEALASAFAVPDGVGVVATIPAHHVYGLLFSVLLPLHRSGWVADDAPLFPEAVGQRLASTGARVLVTVPAHLRALADAPTGLLAGVQRIFSSGAPLPADTAARVRARHGLTVTEVFGSTETGGIAWRQRTDADDGWTPLPGVAVAVQDGQLLVDSPFLAPDEPRPRRSEDRAEPLPGGRFRHLGRADDVVKIASKRVSVHAVTQAILGVSGVRDAAVLARAEGDRLRLHALVAADPALAPALRARIRARFDAVATPRFTFVEALPREANGKLPRARLEAALEGEPAPEGAEVPADHPAFDGHFPGDPLLPAVIQLTELVAASARRAWPDAPPITGLRRWRFRRAIRPGDRVRVELDGAPPTVRVRVLCGDELCSEGTVLLDQPSPPPTAIT